MSTSRVIDKAALDHLQMVNVSDVSSLLPGGKTVNPNLMKDNVFSIRDGGVSQGNASFGTAVEVDGGEVFIEQLTACTDERLALQILVFARCLADEHHTCVRVADAEHRLRAAIAQRATTA